EEVLHRRFAGFEGVATVAGEHVARDRAHFEADEGGGQVLGGREVAHSGGGEEDQRKEFSGFEIFALEIGAGGEDDKNRNETDQQVEEDAEGGERGGLADARAVP